MSFDKFVRDIKKVNSNRTHKVTNSYGSKDAFKYYRKIKPNSTEYTLTDCQYLAIIRTMNNYLREQLINGKDVLLPERMGRLELRKKSSIIKFKEGKLQTNLPINWNETLKLWYNDPISKNKKTLVRQEVKEIFKILYNRSKANYNNKSYYEFTPNRYLKLGLKDNINLNKLDAFTYGK